MNFFQLLLAPALLALLALWSALCSEGGATPHKAHDAPTPPAVVADGAAPAQEEAAEDVLADLLADWLAEPAAQCPAPATPALSVWVAGDYLMVADQRVPVSTKVVPWHAEAGFGFGGHSPGPEGPRFSERKITDPALADEVKTKGWNRERLAQQVDQFVLHFDGCCTSRQCAGVLEDRGLSIHFLLDADGTVYQALDLTARAWHATIANDRAIGIEIANPGAVAKDKAEDFFARFYLVTADGWPVLCPPAGPDPAWLVEFLPRPARAEMILGPIHQEPLAQYDYTPQQYEALARLLAALHREFPKIALDAPREADGTVKTGQLTPGEFKQFHGVLGHYHVQRNKVDPGPAMQWDWLLARAKEVANESSVVQSSK